MKNGFIRKKVQKVVSKIGIQISTYSCTQKFTPNFKPPSERFVDQQIADGP